MEINTASSIGPSSRFPNDGSAHFAPAHYSFSPTSEPFSIEQNLDIGEGFTSNPNSNVTSRVHSGGDIISTTGSLTHENVHNELPSNRQSGDSVVNQHKGSQDTQDSNFGGGDAKRKRSKVSRACDQCRRKKVRCDADSESGMLKTCSHCQKAGQTCDFSRIPQKRGPSKGYIKELSERVQQVEGQLALQYSPGLRSSMDGQAPGVFGDHIFSSEDDETSRRQSSLSLQRNPFADLSRDRIPSIGGWHGTSNPHISRDRERSSIAIPPDQQFPAATNSLPRPFWTDFSESPTKRRKTIPENVQAPDFDQGELKGYLKEAQSRFSLLPEVVSIEAVLQNARNIYQHAFIAILQMFRVSIASNEIRDPDHRAHLQSSFATDEQLEEFILTESTGLSSTRSDADNLILTWVTAMYAVGTSNDVLRLNQGSLSTSRALTIAILLIQDYLRSFELRSEEQRDLKALWFRAWHYASLLVRLYACGLAGEDLSLEARFLHILSRPKESLSKPLAYVCCAAGYLEKIADLNTEVLYDASASRTLDRLRLQIHLREVAEMLEVSDLDPLVREMNQFVRLLTLRVGSPGGSPDLVSCVAELISSMQWRISSATNNTITWDPLFLHTFTISTLTLLELVKSGYPKSTTLTNSLHELRKALELAREHTNFSGKIAMEKSKVGMNWADVLLRMIDMKMGRNELNGEEPTTASMTEAHVLLDFGILVRRGYLNVLIEYANKLELETT